VEGVLASDLHKGVFGVIMYLPMIDLYSIDFWDLGHELFKSDPKTFPVPFIAGDVFDPTILEPVSPHNNAPATPLPTLSSLTSLNPLSGHVSIIHASSFFHLFSEERQLHIARALAGLLSPEPGSVILGLQMGCPAKDIKQTTDEFTVYCHSPESWEQLWVGRVFDQSKVKVEVSLQRIERQDLFLKAMDNIDIFVLAWSVTRV